MIECRLLDEPIDFCALMERAGDPGAGAIATFVGTVRNSSPGRASSRVERLDYEAYVPMAEQELRRICEEAVANFGAANLLVHHRVGRLAVGDAAVAVVVATPHRGAAFDACRYVIEELKKRVPIWKKEVFDDGAEWVNAHP
jgi:molybdopterin synthase catalytic subunit